MQGQGSAIKSVVKAVKILEQVMAHPDGSTLTGLSLALGQNASTVHHLTSTLRQTGLLQHSAERGGARYCAGDAGDGQRHRLRVNSQLSGPGRPATHPNLGLHACFRHEVRAAGAPYVNLPRPGHHDQRVGL